MKTIFTPILFLAFLLDFVPINVTKPYLQHCWGANPNSEKAYISFIFNERPIKEVLKKISESTGYNITLNEEFMELSVSANLKNLTIEESLKEILRNLNNIVITNEKEKTISIIIYKGNNPDIGQGGENKTTGKSILPLDIEVIPPSDPHEIGITQKELKSILEKQKEVDLLDVEVIPPMIPGDKGITQRELNHMLERQNNVNPLDVEVIPSPVPGEQGITKRELNAIKELENKVDILDIEVIPPTVTGGRGITQRELNAITARENNVNPDDLEVIPPSEPGGRGVTLRELRAIKGR